MMIKMLFGSLRLNEFLSYCGEILNFLKSVDKEGLQINTAIDGVELNYEKAIEVANRNRTSQFTDWLQKNDHRRDESFIAFRNLIEANTHRKSDEIVEASGILSRIIRSHDWSLQRKSRSEQSAKMASLVKELSSSENASLIARLSATEWYQDMLDDNTEFLQLQEDKTVADASEADYDTLEVYKDLRIRCEQLLEGIEVLNRIAPNVKYDEMEKFINDCTQRYLTAVKARKTKTKNEKEEQEV